MALKTRSFISRSHIFSHLALLVVCFIVGFPMIFTIAKSTQNSFQFFTPDFMPGSQIFQNYIDAWTTGNLAQLMGNTIMVAVFIMAGKTIFSLLAGTAFVYFRFPLKGPLFIFLLLTLMMPPDILVVALFRLMTQL